MRDEYEITNSIQILIDDGFKVAAESVVDWDLNVTFPGDLLDANIAYLDHLGVENLIDDTASVEDGVVLEKCVIGAGARVTGPGRLREAVVLSDAVVDASQDLRRALVSKDLVSRC